MQKMINLWSTLLWGLVLIGMIGCDQNYEQINETSTEALLELAEAFPKGDFGADSKSDGFWQNINPCKILSRLSIFVSDADPPPLYE